MKDDLETKIVREGFSFAPMWKRAIAYTIDEIIITTLIIMGFSSAFEGLSTPAQVIVVINKIILFILLLKVLYHWIFVYLYGATVGKLAVRIRVVDEGLMDNPTLTNSLIRAGMRLVSEGMFYVGFLWGAFSKTRQTWHDISAKTLVINIEQNLK
jgi:uncharacterized RDD family membrane protein YckC